MSSAAGILDAIRRRGYLVCFDHGVGEVVIKALRRGADVNTAAVVRGPVEETFALLEQLLTIVSREGMGVSGDTRADSPQAHGRGSRDEWVRWGEAARSTRSPADRERAGRD